MSDEGTDPVDIGESELDLYIENGEVFVSGPTEDALAYIDNLRNVGAEVSAVTLTGRRAADVAALLATAGAARQAVNGGVYLRVAEESLPHLAKGGLIPTKDGVHTLGMVRNGSQISHHVRFTGQPVNPVQMLNLQMVAVQLALRMAIAEVTESIKRVEGKVDALLKLAHADRAGNVLGLHQTLSHYCELLEESGTVSTSDWNAIASAGAQLSMLTNQLRKHVSNSLAEIVVSAPIGQRADAVSAAVETHRIDQTLCLLVVVEDAMFKFQQLRVAHVQRTEPEFLESTVMSARQELAENGRIDEELYTSAHATLNAASVIRPLEIHRLVSVNKLSRHTEALKEQLEGFSRARRLQVGEWYESERPTVADAAVELGKRIAATGKKLDAVGDRVVDQGFARLDSLGRALQDLASQRVVPPTQSEANTLAEPVEVDELAERTEGEK